MVQTSSTEDLQGLVVDFLRVDVDAARNDQLRRTTCEKRYPSSSK
jgi:hypothetical protein